MYFFGAIRAEFLMTTNRFYFTSSGGCASISFLTSILSPDHLLLLFNLPMPDDFSLTNSLSPFLLVGAASPSTCN